MSDKPRSRPVMGPKALEMVMRDVLGGMEDLAIMKYFESSSDVFQVVAIEPPVFESSNDDFEASEIMQPIPTEPLTAQVIPFQRIQLKTG